jgi:acetyl-CoA carboxylase/biotin carboxylase 1
MIQDFRSKYDENAGTGLQLRFPAERVVEVLTAFANGIQNITDKTAFETLTDSLLKSALPYAQSHASGVPGSERVMNSFLEIMREWVSVERWFCEGKSYADAVDNLRRANKDAFDNVIKICRAHAQIEIPLRSFRGSCQ